MRPTAKSLLLKVAKPFTYLVWFLCKHVQVCLASFDSIHDVPVGTGITVVNYRKLLPVFVESSRLESLKGARQRFFIPLLIVAAVFTGDSLWYFVVECNFDSDRMAKHPDTFTHRLYEEPFWPQGDVILCLAMVGIWCNGWHLYRHGQEWFNLGPCMMYVLQQDGAPTLIVDNQRWDTENSIKLLKARKRNQFCLYFVVISAQLVNSGYFFWRFSLGLPKRGLKHYLLTFLYLEPLLWTCGFCKLQRFINFWIYLKKICIFYLISGDLHSGALLFKH